MPIWSIPYLLTFALLFLAMFCIAFLSLCVFKNYFRLHFYVALILGTEVKVWN